MRGARLFLLWLALLALPAHALVKVTFINAQHYADTGYFTEPETALYEIEQHLKSLGERYLPPDQTLSIEVLNVDLAGQRDFLRGRPPEVRILRGRADWPSMRVRFVLESGGVVLARGEEIIADRDYLERANRYPLGESYRYEKRMLDQWFKERFVERRAGNSIAPGD